MPSYECQCGAKYRFPESAIGKKAKCKRCGAVFTLESDEIGLAPLAEDLAAGLTGPAVAAEAALAGSAIGVPRPMVATPPSVSPPLVRARSQGPGYWDNVLWTILFAASPSDLLIFVGIWIGYSFLSILPFVSVVVAFWYCTFRFQIIENAAAGEEGFPSFELGTDIIADYLSPFFRWVGSWLIILLPAFIYITLVEAVGGGSTGIGDALRAIPNGLPGLLKALGTAPLLMMLIGGGLFLWPMVILCMTLGGFSAVFRVDLMVLTIARTLPAYLATIGLVIGATIAEHYISVALAGRMAPAAGAGLGSILTSAMLVGLLLNGLTIYADFVALRCIGLYYHHFKNSFAWDWG